jgi:hypothetical protein
MGGLAFPEEFGVTAANVICIESQGVGKLILLGLAVADLADAGSEKCGNLFDHLS